MISHDDIVAFDECSVLNTCEIKLEPTYKMCFGKEKLTHKNYHKLKSLIETLNHNGIPKYTFEPSSFDNKAIYVFNGLIEEEGDKWKWLGETFKAKVIEQLENFRDEIKNSFNMIPKHNNIAHIKQKFIDDPKQLTKGKNNIPGDDDCKIIAGYSNFKCNGVKYLISQDEHFWGYKDTISSEFHIKVIEEWTCHKLI